MSLLLRIMTSCCGLFAAMRIAGCGGHVGSENPEPDSGGAGTLPAGVGGTAGAGGASGGTGGSSSGGNGGMSTADAGACYAACGTPAGTVQTFSSPAEVYAALVGAWVICPGSGKPFPTAPADTVGVEFTPPVGRGGDMYYLVQGPSGAVRGAGFDYQHTYDVSQSGSLLQLNIHPLPNSGFAPSFRFSPCPTQWQMGAMYGGEKAILVPSF